MENLTSQKIEKIQNFFNEISLNHLDINDFVNVDDLENLDIDNAFDEIYQILEDSNAFDIEIIYYKTAIDYLSFHDPSLTDSIQLANDLGYSLEKINSELLASLLASQITREAFSFYEDEINEFFQNIND